MNQEVRTVATTHEAQFAKISAFVLDPDLTVPEETLFFASTLLIDTLGVAVGGASLESGRIARNFAADFHVAGQGGLSSTMLFDGRRVSLPGAAWAIATQIDNLDGHDGYNPTKGHIGCAVVPALLAFAEQNPELTGRQALAALAMSYEVAARAGISLHRTVSDYHTSGAWNALGVAALGCRLTGSAPNTLREAMGIAEYHGPRSQMMREINNPTMLHDGSGMGALVGSNATIMANRGFTGAPAITVESADIADIWQDLGTFWTTGLNYIKPYPICRWAHAALDALHNLMQDAKFTPDQVERISVHTFDEASRLFMGAPETTSQAQYSLAFAMAVLLTHGRVGAEHISDQGLQDERILAIIPKIQAIETARHSDRFPIGRWSDIEVVLKDGRTLASGDIHARGGPEAPMADHEVKQKFLGMAQKLNTGRQEAIWSMRDRLLKPETQFSSFAELLYPEPEAS